MVKLSRLFSAFSAFEMCLSVLICRLRYRNQSLLRIYNLVLHRLHDMRPPHDVICKKGFTVIKSSNNIDVFCSFSLFSSEFISLLLIFILKVIFRFVNIQCYIVILKKVIVRQNRLKLAPKRKYQKDLFDHFSRLSAVFSVFLCS